MSTARLQALEDCLRKRADKLLEINQQQQRRLDAKIRRLHAQSLRTICAYKRAKELFQKQYSYLNDIVVKTPNENETDNEISKSSNMMSYPWKKNDDHLSRYMAVVRANNVVHYSEETPQFKVTIHSGRAQKRKSRYFHASSMLLQDENTGETGDQSRELLTVKMKISPKVPKIQSASIDKLAIEKVYEENDSKETSVLLPVIKYPEENKENPSRNRPRVLRFSLPSLY